MAPPVVRPSVKCVRRGCSGTCPLRVIEAGFRPGKTRAVCFECGQEFAKPNFTLEDFVVQEARRKGKGKGGNARKDQDGQPRGHEKELKKQLAAANAKLAALQAAGAADRKDAPGGSGAASDPAGASEGGGAPGPAGPQAAVKVLQKRIQQVKYMDPTLREALCAASGGHEALLKSLEDELAGVWAKQREQKPLDEQKASAEAHHKRMQKAKDDATSKLEDLRREYTEIAAKIVEQQAAVAEAEAKLQKAKLEVVTVAERAAAELRGANLCDSAVTATAVREYFDRLPPEVASHPEGQDAIKTVMDLMHKLDGARQVAVAGAGRGPVAAAAAAAAAPGAPGALGALGVGVLAPTVVDDSDEEMVQEDYDELENLLVVVADDLADDTGSAARHAAAAKRHKLLTKVKKLAVDKQARRQA